MKRFIFCFYIANSLIYNALNIICKIDYLYYGIEMQRGSVIF